MKIPGVVDNPNINSHEHFVVGRDEQEAKENAAKKFNVDVSKVEVSQDEDVLDTWFSSGLFPFSTMGWPNKEADDLKAFFPGDLLETGHDILFFWVARMVMMSLELTDKLPFHTVFLHPMVKDEEGGKMSKSKGNVIDPLEVMDSCTLDVLLQKLYDSNLPEAEIKKTAVQKTKEFPNGIPECGTDALRFALLNYMIQSSINLDVKRVVGYRNFCNKLWNINKFALSNFTEGFQPEKNGVENLKLSLSDKWILTRLSQLIESTNDRFEKYDFGYMVQGLYDFWLKELADYYIEALKPVMKGNDEEAKKAALNTLYLCLDSGLRMLHPAMPYLTEELFQRLPHRKGEAPESICIAPFPETMVTFKDEGVEDQIAHLQLVVSKFRSQFAALNVPKNANPEIFIKVSDANLRKAFDGSHEIVSSMVRASKAQTLAMTDADPVGCLKSYVTDQITILVKVVGIIDIKLEIERINERNAKLQDLKDKLEKKQKMKGYEQKVPENVRQADQEKLNGYLAELESNEKSANELKNLQ